jgi:hypothetical protein
VHAETLPGLLLSAVPETVTNGIKSGLCGSPFQL